MKATKPARLAAALLGGLLLLSCGADYEPPQLETTGVPATPIGQVLDLDVVLPQLRVQGAAFDGVTLDVRVELERVGPGEIPARVVELGSDEVRRPDHLLLAGAGRLLDEEPGEAVGNGLGHRGVGVHVLDREGVLAPHTDRDRSPHCLDGLGG